MFDSYDKERLRLEESELRKSHPGCEFWLGEDYAFVRVWHSVAGSYYLLRVYVPGGYPDAKPRVYVERPVPLPSYFIGKTIAAYAPSHNYHVLSTSDKGEIQICHFSDATWDASKTIHLVLLKAKLWLQAYGEHHLRTGQPICDFFSDCQ